MNFTEYQERAAETAMYPKERGLEYTVLGLASEAGEVAGKLKKVIRDEDGVLSMKSLDALFDELGDVLWYVAMVAKELRVSLDTVAENNIQKLASRKARGKITGSGDAR